MLATSGSAYHSVGAGIRPGARRVIRVIRAIEAVVVVAADEMAPSSTKVIVAHVTSAKAAHVTSAKASHVTAAKAAHVTSAKATHVTAAKATHMAATATATHMASAATATATATAATGLGTRGNKAAGKQCTCQNHHRSSSHNILQLVGRTFRHRPCLTLALFSKVNANVAVDWRW